MNRPLVLALALLLSPLADASADRAAKARAAFDRMDRQDFLDGLERANACTQRKDYACSETALQDVKELISTEEQAQLWQYAQQQVATARAQELARRQAEAARQAALRQQQAQQAQQAEASGFQWGKFAAMTAGAALGGGLELDSAVQADLVMGIARDSMAGTEGMSNFQQVAENHSRGSSGTQGGGTEAAITNAFNQFGAAAGGGGGGGSIASGTYVMEDGSHTADIQQQGSALAVTDLGYTTIYQPQGDGSYMGTSSRGTRYFMKAAGNGAILIWREGNTPSRMNRVGGGGASVASGDNDAMAVAEKYRALSQSDPDNAQSWTACSAAALKRSVATGAEADAYGRQMASMLQQILVDPNDNPCEDAIPPGLW